MLPAVPMPLPAESEIVGACRLPLPVVSVRLIAPEIAIVPAEPVGGDQAGQIESAGAAHGHIRRAGGDGAEGVRTVGQIEIEQRDIRGRPGDGIGAAAGPAGRGRGGCESDRVRTISDGVVAVRQRHGEIVVDAGRGREGHRAGGKIEHCRHRAAFEELKLQARLPLAAFAFASRMRRDDSLNAADVKSSCSLPER